MPSRKTKSRKPKYDVSHLGMINAEDNACNIVEWLKSGEFTPKLVKKHLRHTLRDISQGRTGDERVCLGLVVTYIWNDKSDDTHLLRKLSEVLTSIVLPEATTSTKRLQVRAWLTVLLYYKHYSGAPGSVIHVNSSLTDAIKSIRSHILTSDEWAETESVGGSLLSVSPVNTLTEAQLVDCVFNKLGDIDTEELWRECERMRRKANSLLRLLGDYHPFFYTCWECDQVFDNVLCCSGCSAASYCSRNCQVTGWNGGHRKQCDLLKKMHDCVLESVEEMERVHVTGLLDNFELSPQADIFDVMRLCLEYTGKFGSPENGLLKGSMKNFYENLGRIARGEWWVYHLSDEERKYDTDNHKDRCHPDVQGVLEFLTVDWFGSTRFKLGTVSVDPQHVTTLTDALFRRKCSTPISAKTFLECYRNVNPVVDYRTSIKGAAYDALRSIYNNEPVKE